MSDPPRPGGDSPADTPAAGEPGYPAPGPGPLPTPDAPGTAPPGGSWTGAGDTAGDPSRSDQPAPAAQSPDPGPAGTITTTGPEPDPEREAGPAATITTTGPEPDPEREAGPPPPTEEPTVAAGPGEPAGGGATTVPGAPSSPSRADEPGAGATVAQAPVTTARTIVEEDEDEPAPRRQVRGWQMALLTLLAVGFLVGAFFLGKGGGSGDDPPGTTGGTVAPEDFAAFNDDRTGVSISYPEAWTTLDSPDEEVRFVATPGGADSVSVRVSDVGFSVEPADLETAQAYTAQLLREGGVQPLEQQAISLNGLPAFYYLYRFTDTDSGQEGVHAHYFVFHGQQMSQLVFQALPTPRFSKLAPVFDQVAQTFKVKIDPATTTTTAAGATTVPPEGAATTAPAAGAATTAPAASTAPTSTP